MALASSFSLLTAPNTFAKNTHIDFAQVTKDISHLASDDMKGRASFSKEIDQAADYIAKRFQEIGLKTFNGSYKQTFNVHSILPKSVAVTLNDKQVAASNIALASTMKRLSWQNSEQTNITVINAEDDFRQAMRKVNAQGGKHLVLANTAHADMFGRYQHYFQGGLTKLKLDHQGAIVVVLTDETQVQSLKVNASTEIKTQQLTNVAGVLPGKSKEKTNENILFSAHYDHIGISKDGGKDVIYNGADDDASGTTAVINIAEHYAKEGNNARSLMFVAFTAEEIGGFGSRHFSQQLDPNSIIAMINIEMIGKPSKFGKGAVWMTGPERSDLDDLLNKALEPVNQKIHQDPYPEQGLFYRSDNATLAKLGVPAHSFSTTQLDKDQHYHQVTDDLASLDLKSMYQAIETLTIASENLVNGSATPTRIDKSKVRGSGLIY